MLKLTDFDYHLPQELIASHPLKKRTDARLLFGKRFSKDLSHHRFDELEGLLKKGDVLVLNDTRVIPARLLGRRDSGGELETFLLKDLGGGQWEALLRPGGRIRKNDVLSFSKNGFELKMKVLDDPQPHEAQRKVLIENEDPYKIIEKIGHMPLPPYINRPDEPEDREFYQTVFSKKSGAIAAPTAGLHFDEALLERLGELGVEIAPLTLEVGYGTFQPILEEDLSKHEMFEESYEITEKTAEIINRAKRENRRIIACGTTSVRALESGVNDHGELIGQKNKTRLFIHPPYSFKIVSGLITNFHLPKSSLLMLVAAFLGGKEALFDIYKEAIQQRYRFYSYGDAMFIV